MSFVIPSLAQRQEHMLRMGEFAPTGGDVAAATHQQPFPGQSGAMQPQQQQLNGIQTTHAHVSMHPNGLLNNNNNNTTNTNNNNIHAQQQQQLGQGVGVDVESHARLSSQYQQLWRQHVYLHGNNKPAHSHGTSGVKDVASGGLLGDDKSCKDDSELWGAVEAQTAFLGPNLWDKSYETDLKYVDLDEFLSENGVSMDGLGSHLAGGGNSTPSHPLGSGGSAGLSSIGSLSSFGGLPTKRERSASPSECPSPSTDTLNPPSPADSTLSMSSNGRDFDPRVRVFSDEELKPQPMIKKSRKQFVPDDLKDDKYWARRRKNNMAAKRSRDARRVKENQIALRAGFLEKENMGLRQELERLKNENHLLRDKLSKYTDV